MRFLYVVEGLTALVVLFLVVTQVLIPATRGQRMFPLFGKQRKLESELSSVVQQREEDKLTKQIVKAKRSKV